MSQDKNPLVEELETSVRFFTFSFTDSKYAPIRESLQEDNAPLIYLRQVSEGLRHAYKFACKTDKGMIKRYYVYDPNDIYVMGWVSYGDFSLAHNQPDKYVVYSTNITNNKYDSYRSQHHIKMSENMATAIRNAKRYLLPINHKEVVKRTLGDTKDKLSDFGREVRSLASAGMAKLGLSDGIRNIVKSPAWIELCHKLDADQHFLSAECKDDLVNARRAIKLYTDHESLTVNMYAVRVYERLGEQTFDVILIPDVVNAYLYNLHIDEEHGSRRYRAETLPKEIMDKVAVLSICEVGNFVEEVGHRSMETLYYVYA
jgi:hypothetical protein|tara:strand:+ start:463 stop:1407 length:945 start_codon:yes stop_codon:yes gene_type:complete